MTMPDEKKRPVVPTRQPKKKTPGTFDNLRQLPQPHPVEELLGLTAHTGSTPSSGSTPTRPSTESRGSNASKQVSRSTAPVRDYTRVANSIVRHAVPSGLFGEQGGKAKELYDTLYALTRGAVVPQRKVRIPKDKLMKKAGIGSEVTLRKNLGRLRQVKLIKEHIVPGTHGGNEYEVFLPEEVGLTPSTASTHSSSPQNQEGVEAAESRGSSDSSSFGGLIVSEEDKTSSLRPQPAIDDDAALVGLNVALREAARMVTGREVSASEGERWREVGEVLAAELKTAAARTTVSSVPAFFAAHLRRRFLPRLHRAPISHVEASESTAMQKPPSTRQQLDLHENIEIFVELIRDGAYTLETLSQQFSPGFNSEDWEQIQAGIIARLEPHSGMEEG